MTPSGPFSGAQRNEGRDAAARRQARPIRLVCPGCGTALTVYEDEVGQTGECPGCGATIAVPADALATAPPQGGDRTDGPTVRASLVRPAGEAAGGQRTPATPAPARELFARTPELGAPEPKARQRPVGRVDYAIWQVLVAEAGDAPMSARIEALRRADEAGCRMTLKIPDGTEQPFPQMVLCEAAVAALGRQSETEWRQEWTRRLVRVAAKWQDEGTFEGVVALLAHVDGIIADLKTAGVWPWAPAGKSSA